MTDYIFIFCHIIAAAVALACLVEIVAVIIDWIVILIRRIVKGLENEKDGT